MPLRSKLIEHESSCPISMKSLMEKCMKDISWLLRLTLVAMWRLWKQEYFEVIFPPSSKLYPLPRKRYTIIPLLQSLSPEL